jgi:hypothetical protein
LSENNEPGWVTVTISKPVQHGMERFWQMEIWLDRFTQLGWWNAADYILQRDIKYGTVQFKVTIEFQLQTNMTATTPSPATFWKLMLSLDIILRQSQIPLGMCSPGRSQRRLGSEKQLAY